MNWKSISKGLPPPNHEVMLHGHYGYAIMGEKFYSLGYLKSDRHDWVAYAIPDGVLFAVTHWSYFSKVE